MKSKLLSEIYEKPEQNCKRATSITEGIISKYSPRGFGFIKLADGSRDIYFRISNVASKYVEKIVEGAKVDFNIGSNDIGLQAVNVRVLSSPGFADATGVIKYFRERRFGSIAVDDGGPDAIFLSRDIKTVRIDTVQVGTRVSFHLCYDGKTRKAIDILLRP